MPGGSLEASDSLRNIRKVIADKRCFSCHSTTDQLAMPELHMDSPSLSNAGGRFNQKWLVNWITDPRKFNPRTHMPKLANKQEATHIAAYLMKDVKKDFNGQLKGDVKNGAGLFYDLGCISCHTRPDKQNFKDTRKSLNYVADKFKPEALKSFEEARAELQMDKKMPNFKLSDKEAEDLASFLINVPTKPSVTGFPSGNVKLGEKLYKEKSCMNCHGGAEPVKLPMKNFSKGCMEKHSKIFMGLNFKFKRDVTVFLNRHRDSLTVNPP